MRRTKTFWPRRTRILRIKAIIPPAIRAIREIRGQLPEGESLDFSAPNQKHEPCNRLVKGGTTNSENRRFCPSRAKVAFVVGAVTFRL